MPTGNYTWEEVMYSLDVREEAERERKEREAIQAEQLAESEAAGWWSLGLSVLGGALFGPPGYFIGKQLGTYGTDYFYDWETMEASEGKFNVEESREFNESIKKAASDQTQGQMVNTLIDLGQMYVQAGGLTEGFDPTIGGGDWTTFGTGEDAWSVFGRGTPTTALDPDTIIGDNVTTADLFYETGNPPPDWSIAGGPSKDYVKSAWATSDIGAKILGTPVSALWTSFKEGRVQ